MRKIMTKIKNNNHKITTKITTVKNHKKSQSQKKAPKIRTKTVEHLLSNETQRHIHFQIQSLTHDQTSRCVHIVIHKQRT